MCINNATLGLDLPPVIHMHARTYAQTHKVHRIVSHNEICHDLHTYVCRDSSVGIATRYGLDGPGIESRWVSKYSARLQTGHESQPAFCTGGTGSFPGVKQPTPSSVEGKERVELYLYSPTESSWTVLG
jgi:hypothetical protein